MSVILLATRNPKKLQELRRHLKGIRARYVTLKNYSQIPPVREDGKSFEENAIKKAVLPSRRAPSLVIAEDSGLCVNVLQGAPGIYSARYARASNRKQSRDAANNAKLLRVLQGVPSSHRQAAFVCVAAVAYRGKLLGVVRGECRGRIAGGLMGKTGFGYDPLFVPVGQRRTFAQLGAKTKDRMSHRARALKKLKPLIQKFLAKHPSSL